MRPLDHRGALAHRKKARQDALHADDLQVLQFVWLARRHERQTLATEVIGLYCRACRFRFMRYKAVYNLTKASWTARGEADIEPPTMARQ